MVEQERRSRVESGDRGTPLPQWEVFVREAETDPLRHVGSVTAGDAASAHEHATRLFGWYAVDVWCCPASEVARFSSRPLDGDQRADGSDERTAAENEEPRVYEETEGTPRVNDA
ncbi:Htur_1727 family rSAM-partnered candidate RiPP [Halovivax sp.]|uniref:Htur_1727 family rSAM-partnered candidate RiPP n=1 Tax=Halovivax sp. TaxID=1935978 RepID=UPI0025C58F91|nr:Htur_1727 family rSAM-partnered candidate RiPP [Halovivax sp.]